MDDDKIRTLAENFYAKQAALGEEFEQQVKAVREDSLRKSIEELGTNLSRRLGAIEERLAKLEGEED